MTTDRVPATAPLAASTTPSYSGDLRTGLFLAEFKSGVRIPVNVSRARAYPGLQSSAPSTAPFYAAIEDLNLQGPVLDAGAGSGEGARALHSAGREVVAVELDRGAAHFVREFVPGVRVVEADLCLEAPVSGMAAAVVADTLGHVADPEPFLRNVHACLAPGATLIVAEPLAQLAQRLTAPARRAFTKQELGAMLTRAGFVVEGWLCTSGTFVACVARRIEDPMLDALSIAGTLAAENRFKDARELLERTRTPRSALALEVLLAQGELAMAERAGDVAARAFFQARDLDPLDARALTGLSRIALSIGETDDALRLAMDAVRAQPASALAAATLAIVGERLEHQEAFNAWRVAVNLAPDDVGIVTGLGRAAAARGEYHYAICAFDRARAYGDEFGPEFHVTLGWLLLADGRRHDAVLEARHAQALAPDDENARELYEAASVTPVE
ncbi:MAG TPA: methyltransferase domain-containing protein [Polyangiaceae bacterium]|nr:methyltransferase domain-containing protein [Polyangiaceae bacterium]